MTFNGTLTGTYVATDGSLTLSLVSAGDFAIAVDTYLGGALLSSTAVPPQDFLPADAFACGDGTLTLSRPEYSGAPVVLTRIGE